MSKELSCPDVVAIISRVSGVLFWWLDGLRVGGLRWRRVALVRS